MGAQSISTIIPSSKISKTRKRISCLSTVSTSKKTQPYDVILLQTSKF